MQNAKTRKCQVYITITWAQGLRILVSAEAETRKDNRRLQFQAATVAVTTLHFTRKYDSHWHHAFGASITISSDPSGSASGPARICLIFVGWLGRAVPIPVACAFDSGISTPTSTDPDRDDAADKPDPPAGTASFDLTGIDVPARGAIGGGGAGSFGSATGAGEFTAGVRSFWLGALSAPCPTSARPVAFAYSESRSPTYVRAIHCPPAMPRIARWALRQWRTRAPVLSKGIVGAKPEPILGSACTRKGLDGRG